MLDPNRSGHIYIYIYLQVSRRECFDLNQHVFIMAFCYCICKSFEALESQNKLQQYKIGEIKKLSNIRFINYNFGPMKVKMRKWSTFSKAKLSPEYLLAQVTGGVRRLPRLEMVLAQFPPLRFNFKPSQWYGAKFFSLRDRGRSEITMDQRTFNRVKLKWRGFSFTKTAVWSCLNYIAELLQW